MESICCPATKIHMWQFGLCLCTWRDNLEFCPCINMWRRSLYSTDLFLLKNHLKVGFLFSLIPRVCSLLLVCTCLLIGMPTVGSQNLCWSNGKAIILGHYYLVVCVSVFSVQDSLVFFLVALSSAESEPFKLHGRGFLSLSYFFSARSLITFHKGVENPSSQEGLFEGTFVLWMASVRGFDAQL